MYIISSVTYSNRSLFILGSGSSLMALSCPTLCHPMDYNLPDSSVHGILQTRILEWVAISFSAEVDHRWVLKNNLDYVIVYDMRG